MVKLTVKVKLKFDQIVQTVDLAMPITSWISPISSSTSFCFKISEISVWKGIVPGLKLCSCQ